ncbi:MAG: phosphate ABC transporter substrate-binding protein PstS [Bacillota bacterium]
MRAKYFLLFTVILFFTTVISAQTKLNGAGATFPYVIYSKWFDVYHQKTGIEFNYQSIGSGGGIKQVIEGTVDFGASDAPMTDEQLKDAQSKRGTEILHIPTVMGAVVLTYNLPQVGKGLKLTPEVLSDIYLGKIKKWNDPRITSINSGKILPNKAIFVAHRSDGSGTTNIFTGYLSKVSSEWKSKVGQGTSVNWPAGIGGKGNEGVSGLVKQTNGAIGYVELAYAEKNGLPYTLLKNRAGNFVEPTFESVSQATAGFLKDMPADFRVEITNAEGKNSYPISGFTWLLIYKNMHDKNKARAIADFLKWAVTEGQKYAKDLYYAPLPKEVVSLIDKKITTVAVK